MHRQLSLRSRDPINKNNREPTSNEGTKGQPNASHYRAKSQGQPKAERDGADTIEALGVPRGNYVVKVNNRKVLDGVMEAISIGGEANAGKRLTVLRAIDKLDRLGPGSQRAHVDEPPDARRLE